MNLKISEIRAVANNLFNYLEETNREEIELDEDYYWMVSSDDAYDPAKDPEELLIGQLSDDWSELKKILQADSPPIGYALVWLSAIIRIIGEKTIR